MTFATSNLSLEITSIELGEVSVSEFETTHLGTTDPVATDMNSKTYLAGTHKLLDGITIRFNWDPDVYAALGVSQTITFTDDDSNTVAGTGFIQRVKPPTYTPDGLLEGEARIRPSGAWVFTQV
jgi:hypothetical protein